MSKGKPKILCRDCTFYHPDKQDAGLCGRPRGEYNGQAMGPEMGCHLGAAKPSGEKVRGLLDEMVRISSRQGYCVEKRVTDGHVRMRNEAGEELEIELLEMVESGPRACKKSVATSRSPPPESRIAARPHALEMT